VTGSVPVFLLNGCPTDKARDAVVGALQDAMSSGRFLERAHGRVLAGAI
jgi:hypothetical protein